MRFVLELERTLIVRLSGDTRMYITAKLISQKKGEIGGFEIFQALIDNQNENKR